jgi:hypothetical protein
LRRPLAFAKRIDVKNYNEFAVGDHSWLRRRWSLFHSNGAGKVGRYRSRIAQIKAQIKEATSGYE